MKKKPLLSGLLILFLTAMIFANIGGNMYQSFMPLYLKDLGAVLFQFPPYRRRNDADLARLLEALPAGTSYAFEFRHDSWSDPEIPEVIAAAGATVCVSDTAGEVPEELPPGPIAYVRLRGDRYTDETRARWLELLKRTAKERDVYDEVTWAGLKPDGAAITKSIADQQDFFVKMGRVEKPVPIDKLVDNSFAEHAVKVLGPYRR